MEPADAQEFEQLQEQLDISREINKSLTEEIKKRDEFIKYIQDGLSVINDYHEQMQAKADEMDF